MNYSLKYKSGDLWVDISDMIVSISGIELRYDMTGKYVLQEPVIECLTELPGNPEIKIYDNSGKSFGWYDLYKKEYDYEKRINRYYLTDILKRLENIGLDFSTSYKNTSLQQNTPYTDPIVEFFEDFGFPEYSDFEINSNIIRLIPWLKYTISKVFREIPVNQRYAKVDTSQMENEYAILDGTATILGTGNTKAVKNVHRIPFSYVCFVPLAVRSPLEFLFGLMSFFGIRLKYYNDRFILWYYFDKERPLIPDDSIYRKDIENYTDENSLSLKFSGDSFNLFYPEGTQTRMRDISNEIILIPMGAYVIASNQYPYYKYIQTNLIDTQLYGRLCAMLPGTSETIDDYTKQIMFQGFNNSMFPPKKWGVRRGTLGNPTVFEDTQSLWESYNNFGNSYWNRCASLLCTVPHSKHEWMISETFVLRKDYDYELSMNIVVTEPDSETFISLQEHDFQPITQIKFILSEGLPIINKEDENLTDIVEEEEEDNFQNILPHEEDISVSLLEISEPELNLVNCASYIGTQTLVITYQQTQGITNYSVRYTLDGTEPLISSNLYTAPISITGFTKIKVKVFGVDTINGNKTVSSKTITEIYSIYQFKNTRVLRTLDYQDQITFFDEKLSLQIPKSLYSSLISGRYKLGVYVEKEYYYLTQNFPVRIHIDNIEIKCINENASVISFIEPDGTIDHFDYNPCLGQYANHFEQYSLKKISRWQYYWLYVLYYKYYGANNLNDQFNQAHFTDFVKTIIDTELCNWTDISIDPDVMNVNLEEKISRIEYRGHDVY